MNKDKKIEMVRKRNELLTKQLQDLKIKLNSERQVYKDITKSLKDKYEKENEEVNSLISELENINNEWTDIVYSLEKKMNEYDELISYVREMKEILFDLSMKTKIPFMQRMKIMFYNYKAK